jgi:hypothetical protein
MSDPTPPPTPAPEPKKPEPVGGVPVVPTLVNGAAGIAATIGTLGAATGGAGVAAAAAVGLGAGGVAVARNRPRVAGMMRTTVTKTKAQRQRAQAARAASRKAAATRKAGVRSSATGAGRRKARTAAKTQARQARSAGVLAKRQAAAGKRTASREAAVGRSAAKQAAKGKARVAKAAQKAAQKASPKTRAATGSGRKTTGPKGNGLRLGKGSSGSKGGRRTPGSSSKRTGATGSKSRGGLIGRARAAVRGRAGGPVARAIRKNHRAATRKARWNKLTATGRERLAARRKRLGDADTIRAKNRDAHREHTRAKKRANKEYRRKVFAASLVSFGRRRAETIARLRDAYFDRLNEIDAEFALGASQIEERPTGVNKPLFGLVQTVPYIYPGGNMSDSFNFVSLSEELVFAAQQGDMDGALNLLALAEQLPSVFTNIANAFATVASRTNDEMPIGPNTVEAFSAVGDAVQKIVDAAEQVAPTFRQEHEADIERLENPRTNEAAWDTVANQ